VTLLDPEEIPDSLELGALAARAGFNFQDEAAVLLCLEMLADEDVVETRCESLDDIGRVHANHIEYIQVKDLDLDQLWSIAKLCEREKRRVGSSILEKSMARATISRPTRFTIVTSIGVKSELDALRQPIGSELRDEDSVNAIAEELSAKLPDAVACPNGLTLKEWVARAEWRALGDLSTVCVRNQLLLQRVAATLGLDPTPGEVDAALPLLRGRIKNAADSLRPSEKRFDKVAIAHVVEDCFAQVRHGAEVGLAPVAQKKMRDARIDQTLILSAVDQRRRYRQELLLPTYAEPSRVQLVASEVQARMFVLRKNLLDNKELPEGPAFHSLCVDETLAIASRFADVPAHLALGSLCDLTNRCFHRFDRRGE